MSRVAPVAPKYTTKEQHSGDLPTRTLDDLGDDVTIETLPPDVIVDDEALAAKEYLDELAFMEEKVQVVAHRGREKHAPLVLDFYCNGKPFWLRVEEPTWVPRKYVEIMARAQPMDVRTQIDDEQGEKPVNRIIRSSSAQYPFTVIEDKNPKGAAWLAKVMRTS